MTRWLSDEPISKSSPLIYNHVHRNNGSSPVSQVGWGEAPTPCLKLKNAFTMAWMNTPMSSPSWRRCRLFHLLHNHNFQRVVALDINAELILCYKNLQTDVEKVIPELKKLRDQYPSHEEHEERKAFFTAFVMIGMLQSVTYFPSRKVIRSNERHRPFFSIELVSTVCFG